MAQLTYKPRPKMHSWTPPDAPKPKRSKFLVWAVLGWLGASLGSYFWLSGNAGETEPTAADAGPFEPAEPMRSVAVPPLAPAPRPAVAPEVAGDVDRARTNTNGELPDCEEFIQEASQATDNRLPLHLGRSALDAFIGENDWAKPCRASQRQTVALCVAIRDGAVVGLTARTSRPNLTLANCLREQAKKLSLQPESTVRVIRTTIHL